MFSDFTGGLNLARPPEIIANNELQEAVNFEFAADTGMLRVRPGLIPIYTFPWTVTDIIPSPEGGVVLVRTGNLIYKISGESVTHIGQVDGEKPASYEQWGDGEKRNSLLMAFGAHLHLYDGETVRAVETEEAPDAVEVVFARAGRVIVAQSGIDTIRYSGVGDPFRWVEDTDADALRIDVGYKDGCAMKAIAALAGELIVFKAPDGQPEHGRVYRLQGDYPNWKIIPHSRGSSAWNSRSVLNVSSDILFLTREGLANLGTVTDYGDFKLGWAGTKVNPALSPRLSEACRLWHLPTRSQAWVSDGVSEDIWCYHYHIGGGAWTTLRFPQRVLAAAAAHGVAYIGMGNTVYRMTDEATDDAGTPIMATLKPKTTVKRNQTLLKSVVAHYQSTPTSEAKVKVERWEMPMPHGGQGGREDIAYSDNDIAYLDDDPLVPASSWTRTGMATRRCCIRRWSITPEVVVKDGKFSLSMLGLEVAEV